VHLPLLNMLHRAKFHLDSSIGSKVIPKKHRYHFYQKQCHKPFYERAKKNRSHFWNQVYRVIQKRILIFWLSCAQQIFFNFLRNWKNTKITLDSLQSICFYIQGYYVHGIQHCSWTIGFVHLFLWPIAYYPNVKYFRS
jgi:hypothetical protein